MSDLKHRTLPELKSFVKKYKEHFKLNVSKVKKDELLKRIDNGMLKAINPTLQKGLKEEYERLRQPKDKKTVPKEKNIEQTLKEHSKHHTKKHMDIMKEEIKKGKTFNEAHKTALKKDLITKGEPPPMIKKVKTLKVEPKPKAQPKKKVKSPCDFDKQYLDVPSDYVEGGNIIYFDPVKNIKLEFFTKNPKFAPDTIRLDYMSSREMDSKDPAPKGATRGALCGVLQELVKRKIVTKNGTIDLIAGKVRVKGVKHSLKKLKAMYVSMGFKKTEGINTYKQKIGDFMKWCKSKYPDCIE